MSPSYSLIIELSRNEKLQKHRIILSQHASHLHKWLVYFLICLLQMCYIVFSEILNVCKPRTTIYLLWNLDPPGTTAYPPWQPGPPGFAFLPSMLTKLAWDGECRLALFHVIRHFLANKVYHLLRLSQQTWAAWFIYSAPYSATLHHEITLKIFEFIVNSIEKVEPSFLFSSMRMFPKLNWTKS